MTSSRTQSLVVEYCSTEQSGSHLEALLAPVQLGYGATGTTLHARRRWWQRFLAPPVLHHWSRSPSPTTPASRGPCSRWRLSHSLAAGDQSDLSPLHVSHAHNSTQKALQQPSLRRAKPRVHYRPLPTSLLAGGSPASQHIVHCCMHSQAACVSTSLATFRFRSRLSAHQALFACGR